MTRVKICGCQSVEQALAAADAGADFVGLIFAESRRRISMEDAAEIVRALGTPLAGRELEGPPALHRAPEQGLAAWFQHGAEALDRLLQRKRPLTVGVFANNDPEEINETVDECGLDLIQLSGGEPWPACLLANRQVIKTVHLGPDDNSAGVIGRVQAGSAMAVHLDKAGPGVFGGSGETIDWQLAAGVSARMPVWLAGGLTPENVAKAIETVRPWCVDVSSGVETKGVKDLAKIRAFAAAVKEST